MQNSALPRTDRRDRRTAAQRAPQVPVSVHFRVGSGPVQYADTKVGIGGWAGDTANALARQLDVPAAAIVVVSEQGAA